ncbi:MULTISPECIES: hypothetical protein [Paenibacillus sonchi group]|uniref:Uncharacterized protein n=2 Tax=Paenibacillus riograndensis TaxID=483937 RepID=A0A132TLC3_9BACL|nr:MULTISPECIES: hypothetical protein [Paenibacillus sonchi group]KWX72094.1 hypothetical protein AMQ84_25750 [Paenibacillus riograndensis]KWX81641.1 hypothetical protein AMQ83_33705 [Paenibacillus riograndensis]MCE3198691.1 hypothetical protein [Paenibacillus sonchi]CQR52387.1 hypothetical protein PRIO_0800 [Paenibacillus riograndensis SBR5]
MDTEKRQEPGKFVGDGFAPPLAGEVGDWGNSDGFSLWDSVQGEPENGLEDWEGRQETHDMFHQSYE